jgi:hypothetical protein
MFPKSLTLNILSGKNEFKAPDSEEITEKMDYNVKISRQIILSDDATYKAYLTSNEDTSFIWFILDEYQDLKLESGDLLSLDFKNETDGVCVGR